MKKSLLLVAIIFGLLPVCAQTDSITLYHTFLQVSSAYQQPPVYITFKMEKETNLILSVNDTSIVDGLVYMPDNKKIYLKVLPVEQFVNDSVGVLIQHQQERIYRVTDVTKLRKQFHAYLSSRLKDSTVLELMNNYSISKSFQDGQPSLLLSLRGVLPQTSIPAIEVNVLYDSLSMKPLVVQHTSRRLLPINESDTAAFINQYGQELLYQVQTGQKMSWYFLHEQISRIIYTDRDGEKVPDVSLETYLEKKSQELWSPAERFRSYRVIEY